MKIVSLLCLFVICILTNSKSYAKVSRSSSFSRTSGVSRSFKPSRSSTVVRRTYVNRGSNNFASGMLTGALVSSALQDRHHDNYIYNQPEPNVVAQVPSQHTYTSEPIVKINLCKERVELYNVAVQICKGDLDCLSIYCYR